MSKSTTIEKNNRFYEQPNGEILTENEQLKEWLIVANKEIERLNKELENLEKLNNANYQSFIEANNIINKLEKEFEEELKNLNYSEDKIYAQGIHDTIISHKYKLQELKGCEDNER